MAQKLVYGHRGAPREAPENTLASFRLAVDLGVDAIETDAHLTRDGHVVLAHDETGERTAGIAVPIARVTLAEVRGWDAGATFKDPQTAGGAANQAGPSHRIPTLEEALLTFPDTFFNVDIKPRSARAVSALVALVRKLRAPGRVRIASFHSSNLRFARSLGYEGETGLGASEITWIRMAPEALLRRLETGGKAAQIPVNFGRLRLDSASFIARCHRLGLRVDYWTIDSPEEAARLFALGADGVVTNDPRVIVPIARHYP